MRYLVLVQRTEASRPVLRAAFDCIHDALAYSRALGPGALVQRESDGATLATVKPGPSVGYLAGRRAA